VTAVPDRRKTRKRLFAAAGASLAAAGAAAPILWPLVAPWAAAIAILAGVGIALAILHRPGAVPILVYHSVAPDADWLPWAANTSVRPQTLRRHLETLRRGGWNVISTRALVAARRDGIRVGNRTVVMHFDDGYLDNFLFAVPLLRQFGCPAAFFVSTDFIDPGSAVRSDAAEAGPEAWRGYMTAAEIREIDADPLFDVEAHGKDHARIPVSERSIGQLTEDNWRRHLPLAWAHDPENKSRWFEQAGPPPQLRPGDPVPANESALAGRWWRDGAAETDTAFAERVYRALVSSRDELGAVLGRCPETLAWPFDRSCPLAVAAARKAGFSSVTGGLGENRAAEDPAILSRVHVQDHAFGGGPPWLEGLAFRARINSAAGRLAWHPVVALAARLRARRFGQPGYGAPS